MNLALIKRNNVFRMPHISKGVTKGWSIALLLACSILIALSVGAFSIPVFDMLTGTLNDQQEAVLYSIRLPRVLLAGLVGAGLAVSGAALQGLFRNPLADPQLIGVSSGAALAVALTIVFIGTIELTGFITLFALSGAAFLGGGGHMSSHF